jgi:RimJ/RimL family protein N-acetyltransferase
VADVRIEPWGEGNIGLLEQCLMDPEMMRHLGGPETAEKVAERQAKYEQPGSRQFKIVDEATGEGAGWVGYWDRNDWRGEDVFETGWAVIPAFQGRGFAGAATAQLLEVARSEQTRRFVHAFPSVENGASNAICRKVGFELLGVYEFEYPKGSFMQCNDWRFDLFGAGP